MIPLYLSLAFIAGMFNAVMDRTKVQSVFNQSTFSRRENWFYRWSNPSISWKNKWKEGSTNKPRFFGSSTIFVFVTDAWHFFQMLWSTTLFILVVIYQPMWDWWGWPLWACYIIEFVILKGIYTFSFTLFYDHIFKK